MTKVVIMAGGRGQRLHPLTANSPKPLLRVGSKPILETILDKFIAQGFRQFTLCVNYKAELIENYFGDGKKKSCFIDYIHEDDYLGTAGALRMFKPLGESFIVHNADIIADIDYNRLMNAHDDSGKDATICLGLHQIQIPFGVVDTVDGRVVIREKPIECFAVNAGVYILPPHTPDIIPEGPMDMPELLSRMSIGTYAIEGFWQDIGHFESLAAAHIDWGLRMAAQ